MNITSFGSARTIQSGYIALISVIIMSALLITLTVALSSANYFSSFNILENEFKDHSSNLAEGCVDYAIGRIAADNAYAGGEGSVPVGSDSCAVVSVSPPGDSWPKTIVTQGVYPKNQEEKSYTNLSVQINSNLSVASWQETP